MDPARLDGYLAQRFGPGEMSLEQVSGGQSCPTYFLDWGPRRMVLRKQPDGPILKGAHAVDREFRVLSALQATEVPTPEPILFEQDAGVIGTPFYLMTQVEGRVFSDGGLPGVSPQDRRAIYLDMAATMARLHRVRPDDVGLGDFGRPGDYFARQIARWSRQWKAANFGPLPELDDLIEWLTAHQPTDDGRVAIAHGDFRPGNMLIHPTEPRVVAVLDWELSTLGHPLADLGFFAMAWHSAPEEYGGILGLDHAALGLPTQDEFVARYMAHAAPTAPLLPFHIAFAMFRFAVIFVGIAERAKAGSAAGQNAADLAPLARTFARRGLMLTRQ